MSAVCTLAASPPGTGAENLVEFILNRDHGSYHELHDSNSDRMFVARRLRDLARRRTRLHARRRELVGYGISAACRTGDRNVDDDWTQRVIAPMARSAEYHERRGLDPHKGRPVATRDEGIASVGRAALKGPILTLDVAACGQTA